MCVLFFVFTAQHSTAQENILTNETNKNIVWHSMGFWLLDMMVVSGNNRVLHKNDLFVWIIVFIPWILSVLYSLWSKEYQVALVISEECKLIFWSACWSHRCNMHTKRGELDEINSTPGGPLTGCCCCCKGWKLLTAILSSSKARHRVH